MAEFSIVGRSVPRIDALDKVTGAAKFAIDQGIGLPGLLYGKILMSTVPHAEIVRIDTSKAERVPGVKAVLTGKDVPEHRTGVCINDRHVLARQRVRFVGDPVAVVAANSVEAAEEAVELINVEYEELPSVFDAEEAMEADCPTILHPELRNYTRPMYDYLARDCPGPNVHTHHKIRRGNVDEAFKRADIIVENRFSNDKIIHCQLEPYNSLAEVDSSGNLTVWTATHQIWAIAQQEASRVFNIPLHKVRARASYMGGMFGAVARAERFAELLALKTGKPVKIIYSRKESFMDGVNRLSMVIYIKDGLRKDGTLIAREMRVIVNTGAYSGWSSLTIRNGGFHASQYRIPNFRWDAYGIYTNLPCAGPYRGFGSAECLWASEQQMDIDAEKVGMDAVEFRKINTVKEGEINLRGEIVHSIGAKECLGKSANWIGWGKPSETPKESHLRRGKGLALGNKYTMADTASSAVVKVHWNGVIEIRHGADECGQGANTVLSQIVAEEFGVGLDKVKVVFGDTDRVPYDYGSCSSRTTLHTGNALILACKDAKRQMFEIAEPILEVPADDLETRDGKIFPKGVPARAISISDLFLSNRPDARGALHDALCLPEGGEILGKGSYYGHASAEDPETGQGSNLTKSHCYGAQAVEVEVDLETGSVKILRSCSTFDAGRTINPKICEGQIEGGSAQGIGSALYEGFVFDERGKLLNPNFSDYKIPTVSEIPTGDNIRSMMVEALHKDGPFGAKGLGEACMNAAAPAIANAIYKATGARVKDMPMSPERVLKAIKEAKERGCLK